MNNNDDNKNMIFFLIASMVLLFAYQFFVLGPQQKARQAQVAAAAASSSSAIAAGIPVAAPMNLSREQALALSPRVPIDTPSLKGSIALNGALLDDLYLATYHETVDPKSPMVELLRPAATEHAYYAESGYFGQNIANLPGSATPWKLVAGTTLGVGKPITLAYDNGAGLLFQRTFSVDANYMIAVDDRVTNTSPQSVTVQPYATITRVDVPKDAGKLGGYVHEGTMATFSTKSDGGMGKDYQTKSVHYKDLVKSKTPPKGESVGGWFGVTDRYWMAAVIPNQHQALSYSTAVTLKGDKPVFRAGYQDTAFTIPSGQTWSSQSHIFAGAKHDDMLKAYEKDYNIPRFKYAIDWGSLEVITHPFYLLLIWLYKAIGNMGLAILGLTVIVKIAFYPLAHKSYETMTKMKHVQQRLQPKLDAIKKRYADDMQKQQEATMELYKEEKVNPMAGLGGCLPMLLQLPVFICLFKVLQMSIEMRHAPFYGWIRDLSAPDPLTIVNLFGLLPFHPGLVPVIGTFLDGPLHIGPVAILYGASMWASQQMTPMAGVDPMQKKMMAFMPLIMVFFFSQLAVGLMIYYFWSNILTMLQQYSIMRRLKVDNPIDDLIAKITGKSEKKKAA